MIEKRGKREKRFLREDGTIIVKVYSDDIHYKKNGKYEEIDNTLMKKGSYYQNKDNDYQVRFQESGEDSLMTMSRKDSYIDIGLKNTSYKNRAKEGRTRVSSYDIVYENIMDYIDIEYQLLPTKVKETIKLSDNRQKNFTFVIRTDLELVEDKNTILAKKDNKTLFTIDHPYMKDNSGEISYDAFYHLRKENTGYELDLFLDPEWLDAKERVYPVYVDPTITNNSQVGGVEDTYIYPGDENINRGAHPYLQAGVNVVDDKINRTLIKFDLPEIGTGSEIVEASIILTGYLGRYAEKHPLASVHRVTEPWTEMGANWNNMHDKYDSKVEAVMECPRSGIYADNTLAAEYAEANITSLVKKWYKDTPNYGVLIKAVEEIKKEGVAFPMFFSKEQSMQGNSPKPLFSIAYRNQNGLENYLNYKEQSFTIGHAYVNTYNGNLVASFDIGETIGGRFPVLLQMIYNTNDVVLNHEIGCGLGLRMNFNQTIRKLKISDIDYLAYTDEDGTIHYFTKDGNCYYDEDGLDLKIENNDTTCMMYDKNDNKMTFMKKNDIYYLIKIEDVNHNTIDIMLDSDNRVERLVDKNGEEVLIQYDSNLIKVLSSNVVVELIYNNEQLTAIKTLEGTTLFAYNENHLITSITDVTGIKMCYEYYSQSPYKVKRVTQYGLNNKEGQSFTLEYGFSSTSIIDNKGRCETLIFNDYGNVLSRNNLHSTEDINGAYSLTQEYGNPTYNTNKILSSSNPVGYINNYLKNTSFEDDRKYFLTNETATDRIESNYSSDYAYSGNRSLRVTAKKAGGTIEQKVVLPKGKYYTFSGYFKDSDHASIILFYVDGNQGIVKSEQEIGYSSDFEREDVTIYYAESATTDLTIRIEFPNIGVLYMDDVQLEEGEVANSYNFIENSDFSDGISDWQLLAKTHENITVDTNRFFECISFNNHKNKALKVKMDPSYITSFKREFPIKGKTGELYTISFWYKSEGVEPCRQYAGNHVTIYFHPKDDSQPGHCIITSPNFNANDERWQYYSYRVRSLEEFDKVIVTFEQNTEANDFCITNLSFYKNVTSGDYDYDEEGNIISIKNQSEDENIFQYDAKNQLIKAITPRGKNFKYEYDNQKTDRVLTAIASNGIANEIRYDSYGNPSITRISKKYKKELENGNYKIRSKGTNKYIKSKLHNILLEDSSCSNTVWKIEKQEDKYKIVNSYLGEYSIAYSLDSVVLSKEDTNNLFELEKNENGSYSIRTRIGESIRYLKAEENSIKLAIKTQEDSYAFEFYFEIIDGPFMESVFRYSEDGRFIKSILDTNFSENKYEIDSKTGLNIAVTNANGFTTFYNHNDKNQLTSISNNDREITYFYNSQNLLEEVRQNNKSYKVDYDEFLNIKKVKIGNDIVLVTNHYEDKNGNLSSIQYGNNQMISFMHDDFDRIRQMQRMDDNYRYIYDSNGNIAKVLSSDNRESHHYDISDRLCEYEYDNFKIKYQYNISNDVTCKKYYLNSILHSLNNDMSEDDLINKVTIDGHEFNYQYDSFGRVLNRNINDSFDTKYHYYSMGKRTTNLLQCMENGNDKYSYEYDKMGNIKRLYYNDQLYREYYYNVYNELVKETDYNTEENIEYHYDNLGNLLTTTVMDMNTEGVIKLDTYQYGNDKWVDQLTKYNSQSITYDEIGNPISIGDNIYMTWINGRSLNTYTDSKKNLNISYKYDRDGLRRVKVVNGLTTNYFLENSDIIYEQRGNNTIFYLYDLTGLAGIQYNNDIYYYVKNMQNDIVGILNSNYEKVVTYEYDSWGKVVSVKDALGEKITDETHIGLINPYRYRSYYYDVETGLYYLNSRYYSPEWKRFLNADSFTGTNENVNENNLYIYGNNNPIAFYDSEGQFAITATLGSIVGAVLLTAAAMMATKQAVKGIAAVVANVSSRVSAMSQTKAKSKTTTSRKTSSQETGEHNVYVLMNNITHNVEYVGRTKDLNATEWRHKKNPFRADLKFDRVALNISKETARGLEQKLIIDCRTLHRNKLFPRNNQIYGVAFKNPKYNIYWDLALTYADENELPCQ